MSRLLCVFAHPDDEVFCAGGTIARYAAEGHDVMVVSATRGDAGQIRDARIATRRTLGKVREQELITSCHHLGTAHASCLDYGDGTLNTLELPLLVEHICKIIRKYRPEVVITFGPDGAYGHPDHIVIGEATTLACALAADADQFPAHIAAGLQAHQTAHLYHSYFPRSRQLMLDKLSHWLMHRKTESGDQHPIDPTDFARALLLFAEETTLLQYASDHIDINWYPNGFYMIEQGEVAKDLYLILSGHAQALREHDDGHLEVENELGPGDFFGEMGVAMRQRRSTHVVAVDNVTCLVMSMSEAVAFAGRGDSAVLTGSESGDSNQRLIDLGQATHCIDVSQFVTNKIAAMSAHRSQFPIQPEMFPHEMLVELMGYEYFVHVLPRPQMKDTLFS